MTGNAMQIDFPQIALPAAFCHDDTHTTALPHAFFKASFSLHTFYSDPSSHYEMIHMSVWEKQMLKKKILSLGSLPTCWAKPSPARCHTLLVM